MCHACDQQLVYQEKECRAQINLTLFKAHNSTFDVYNVPVAPMFTWVKSATGHSVVKPSLEQNVEHGIAEYIHTYIVLNSTNKNSKENHSW